MSEWVQQAVGGSMLLAVPIALLAGLVSFFSPCVLPLLPGYLSFASGLGTAELAAGRSRTKVLAGTLGFLAGLSLVFVATGALAGGLGSLLIGWRRPLAVIAGLVSIVLGLAFGGWLPLRGSWRMDFVPRFGVAAAPLLGIVFALGWTPCIGPALSVVLSLALNEATAVRGGVLALCYSLGLGLPFVLAGLAFERFAGGLAWVRRHQVGLQRTAAVLMILVGVLLVTGVWDRLISWMQVWSASFGTVI